MTSPQDNGLVFGVESTYGTIPTLNRWLERRPGAQFKLNKSIKQATGLRVGSRVARSARRVITRYDPTAAFEVEVMSKGQGLLWQALMGSGTSTLVSGSTYQQVFTLGDAPTSLAIQNSLYNAGTGAMDPYTYAGMMCDSFEIDFPNADLLTLKTNWKGKSQLPSTATAIPAYTPVTSPSIFQFAGGTIFSGTLTAPTSTTLASATTPIADVRGGTVKVDNGLHTRPNVGGDAKPIPGIRVPSGTLDIEYDSTTFRDAVMNDTPLTLLLNYQSTVSLSTGFETFQVVVPEIKFDDDLPQDNQDDIPMQSMNWWGLDNLTAAQPLWIVLRTSDTAL